MPVTCRGRGPVFRDARGRAYGVVYVCSILHGPGKQDRSHRVVVVGLELPDRRFASGSPRGFALDRVRRCSGFACLSCLPSRLWCAHSARDAARIHRGRGSPASSFRLR